MLQGHCECDRVRIEVDGPIRDFSHCHCSQCRRLHGGPFATFGGVRRDELRYTSGEDVLRTYTSSPKGERVFCSICGSNVPTVSRDEDHVRIPMGTVDDDPDFRPKEHYFTASKAPWFEITDELPQHKQLP